MSKTDPTVYVCFPTVNFEKCNKTLAKWHDMGYRSGLFINSDPDGIPVTTMMKGPVLQDISYKGYWWACNHLVSAVFDEYPVRADLVVLAADDMDPDPNKTARELGREYFERFPNGEGIMQPCGDKQGGLIDGKWASQRICGSPWFGRGWYEMGFFNGKPTFEGCFHFYSDELLFDVSRELGLLWLRDDVTQFHRHWSWGHGKQEAYQDRNSRQHWRKDQETYEKVKEEYIKKALEKDVHRRERVD